MEKIPVYFLYIVFSTVISAVVSVLTIKFISKEKCINDIYNSAWKFYQITKFHNDRYNIKCVVVLNTVYDSITEVMMVAKRLTQKFPQIKLDDISVKVCIDYDTLNVGSNYKHIPISLEFSFDVESSSKYPICKKEKIEEFLHDRVFIEKNLNNLRNHLKAEAFELIKKGI